MAFDNAAKVCNLCEDAKTTGKLDLRECGLLSVPQAIFFIVRNSSIRACDISKNMLSRIPVKIAQDFKELEDLNASHNKFSDLPDNFGSMDKLLSLDLSNNKLKSVNLLFSMANLRTVILSNNDISDLDVDLLRSNSNLQTVDLRSNPLSEETINALRTCDNINNLLY